MSLWMVRGGRYGEHESLALEQSLSCIGFSEASDLSVASNKETMRDLVRKAYPDASEAKVSNFCGQLYSFAHRMKTGDLVVMPLKSQRQIAVATVIGPYQYRPDLGEVHHARKVEWLANNIPRTRFGQDLLLSFGATMTVCQIQRNNAEERIKAILEGKPDPGGGEEPNGGGKEESDDFVDIEQLARDQILSHLDQRFKGHGLARLVDAVLQAECYVTSLSQPGPDGGVDILAGRGGLGFEGPRLCVQVKSGQAPADVTVLRALQGSMTTFKAEQGLLVSWGGFNNSVQKEARLSFFLVRLWDANDLVEAVLRTYDRLPEELQNELPLKRLWALVPEE